jgi:Xaa-Pro aminopeptidase
MDFERIKAALRDRNLDAWVLWDFRGSNPVFWEVLATRAPGTSRRAVLVIPADGEPELICSALDEPLIGDGVPLVVYRGREEFEAALAARIRGRVAMEYSPRNALPIVAWVDAGAVELIRSLGAEVESSADLFQAVAAAWDAESEASHHEAVGHVMELHALAREHAPGATERGLVQRILDEIARRGLQTDGEPGVSVGAHTGDPHHAATDAVIGPDAVLMVDIWARLSGPRTVFGDVTWMWFTGTDVPDGVQTVVAAVAAGRDAALALLDDGTERRGFELDRAARAAIEAAGYGHGLMHRTGHSLGVGGDGSRVHGLGANLDDFETHDDRRLLPGTGFTVEPGIYLPEFGVRLECNVHLHPQRGATVTTPLQTEMLSLQ